MFHQNFLTSTKRISFQIQNNVSKLLITVRFKSGLTPQTNYTGRGHAMSVAHIFNYALTAGTLSVTRHSAKLGPKVIIQTMPLGDLAEICANNEGFVEINQLTSGVTANGVVYDEFICRFSIELCNVGSIHSDQGDFLKIDFEGFDRYSDNVIAEDVSIDVNSFGSYVVANEHIHYGPVACQANQQVQFDCVNAYNLALPASMLKTSLTSLTGEVLEINGDEMETVACDLSDIVFMVDGISLPFLNWRIFPIQLASKANVQLNVAGTVYQLTNKNYDHA